MIIRQNCRAHSAAGGLVPFAAVLSGDARGFAKIFGGLFVCSIGVQGIKR
jgi:hypothetical protein